MMVTTAGIPADLDDGWVVGDPGEAGFDATMLADMRRRITEGELDNVHAVLIARDGVLAYEQYRAGEDRNGLAPPVHTVFDASTRHNGNSITKSLVSLLVGIALQREWIPDVDTPVFSYFPEYEDICTPSKRRITLRHLLAMADGLEWDELTPPYEASKNLREAADPYRYILQRNLVVRPGRAFNYNSGATELLAEILRRRSGRTIDALAADELLEPLGIEDTEWNRYLHNGYPQASGALRLRPRDWAKLGQFVLNRGSWNRRQLVSSEWIAESTKAHNNGSGQFLYGYQWWLARSYSQGRIVEWIGGMGWAGQRLIILPSLRMVVLVHAYLPERMNLPESILLNQYILPAVLRS
jgi:CubicO group peptidase (beta-lactamase class C family)